MIFSKNFISATPANIYTTYEKPVSAPLMRRSFVIDKLPKKAEITITGLGFYKLFVNGKDITKGLIAPYRSNPEQIVYFDNYDIREYLTVGKNTLGFVLGNGFHNYVSGIFDSMPYRSSLKLAFALELDEYVIEADENVKTAESPIIFDDCHAGVHYDAQLEVDGWNLPDFDDTGWKDALYAESPRGEFVLCKAHPVRTYREISPIDIKDNVTYQEGFEPHIIEIINTVPFYNSEQDDKASGFLYDFGENNSGVFRLKLKNTKKGQRIVLQMAERHFENPGKIDFTNWYFFPRGFAQRSIYICRGKDEEIFIPDFAFYGFRYCHIAGITEEQATADALTFLVSSSDTPERASFTCSHDVTNKIWDATVRSDRSNFYYHPLDCPHREKGAWTGDASLSSEHMLMKYDCDADFKDWLCSIRYAQSPEGIIPARIPVGYRMYYNWGHGPWFDSVIFNIPYYLYTYRGDTEVIKENAIMFMRYLDYISKKRDNRGLIAFGLGDWCPVGRDCPDYVSPLEFTDTVGTMENARKAAVMFRAIGFSSQAKFAEKLFAETREAIRKHLIDFNTMTVAGACQTSQALALEFGVFDPEEKNQAYSRLIDFIAEKDDHFDTGIYGGRHLFNVLSDFGDHELAYKMITRPDYPSYGNWIARGATTMWEEFFPEDSKGSSLNHHFWGHVSAWFIKNILGIRVNPDETNPKNINIKPAFISEIDNAKGYYDTVCGKLCVEWVRENGKINLCIDCPDGICGKLILPAGFTANGKNEIALSRGKQTFKIKETI